MFRKPLSVKSVAEFLPALRKSLRWRTDIEKIEEIVREAEMHLMDRIEVLVEQGRDRAQAEQIALAGFGDPREFATAVADGVVDTRLAQTARVIVLVGVFVLCGLSLGMCVITLLTFTNRVSMGLINAFSGVTAFTILSLPLAIFLGRRPQTRVLALCLTATAILGAVLMGTLIAPAQNGLSWRTLTHPGDPGIFGLPRIDYSQEIATERRWRDRLLEEQALVKLAKATYAVSGAPVPAKLRVGTGYLVPSQARLIDDSRGYAFRQEPPDNQVWELYEKRRREGRPLDSSEFDAMRSRQPLVSVATYNEATLRWSVSGTKLEKRIAEDFPRRTLIIEQYRRTMEEPWRFNFSAAVGSALVFFVYSLFLLALDIALSLLGRLAYLLYRNLRRRRPNPTTAG
jgi:hypothetical protein